MSSLFPTFHETLGAASIGFSLSCGVFGILTTQMFIYFRRYPRDKIGYKILVSLLFLRSASNSNCRGPGRRDMVSFTPNSSLNVALDCHRFLELIDQIFVGYSIYYYTIS